MGRWQNKEFLQQNSVIKERFCDELPTTGMKSITDLWMHVIKFNLYYLHFLNILYPQNEMLDLFICFVIVSI
jgi:hypothetical protein